MWVRNAVTALLCVAITALVEPAHGSRSLSDVSGASLLPASRSLLQAAAAASTPAVPYADELSSNLAAANVPGRPISYKNLEAMLALAYAQAGRAVSEVPSVQVPGSEAWASWQNTSGAVVVTFPANTSDPALNGSDAAFSLADVAPLLQGNFSGAYASGASSNSSGLLGVFTAGNLQAAIANVSADEAPRRVVCAGFGDGGAAAQLCGVWAAVTYPRATTRVLAFGAPTVGNANFAFAFQQLVDLSYLWSTSTHLNTTNATRGGQGPADEVRVLNDTATVGNRSIEPNSFAQYVSAVIEYYNVTSGAARVAGSAAGSDSASGGGIGGFFGTVSDTVSNIVDTAGIATDNLGSLLDVAASLTDRGATSEATDRAQEADATRARAAAEGCPVLLCKVRTAATQACNVYSNATSGTIAPGSVSIGPVAVTGVNLAVAWSGGNRTATVVFQGSTSREDWLTNFQVSLQQASTNAALDQVFPNVRLHSGFLSAFQSVTEEATSQANNVTAVLYRLSSGVAPTRIEVAGHSLGAATATIFGAWAALQWPAADIQVVTFGAPLPGNRMFAEAYKFLTGRQQRVINKLDIVPALPPLEDYTNVEFGRWIPRNSTVILQDRPMSSDIKTYTWDDHACRVYEANVYRTSFMMPPDDVAAALTNSSNGAAAVSDSAAVAPSTSNSGAGSSGDNGSDSSSSPGSSSSGSGSGSNDSAAGAAPAPAPQHSPRSCCSGSTIAMLSLIAVAMAAV